MPVDKAWVQEVRGTEQIEECATFTVEGVDLVMPVSRSQTATHWQRRVSDDILPDSPNADAPEKTPFDILNKLTDASKPPHTLGEALADSEQLSPLKPLFVASTRAKTAIPIAFHVLAVKAADRPVNSRSFKHHTFLLLMRDAAGSLDVELVRNFIERFRSSTNKLGLAERAVLDAIEPGWDPATRHQFSLDDARTIVPFVPEAGRLLQRDLRTLLAAPLMRTDFFRYTNQLLSVHLGLYQTRLAAHLNPAMDALLAELRAPGSVDTDEVVAIEEGRSPRCRFFESLDVLAPGSSARRRMGKEADVIVSFRRMEQRLAELHFYLMMINRLRSVVTAYLLHKGYDKEAATLSSRRPSQIIERVQNDPDFRRFLERAGEALAVRFVLNQLSASSRDDSFTLIGRSGSGFEALKQLYGRYNLETSPQSHNSRAYKQGGQVVRRLLGAGEHGLVQSRRNAGSYFELGSGLLPLLLLTTIGADAEKLAVHSFWHELAAYGLRFAQEEREILLGRLKSMGLYERYSDAGEASYVRGIITSNREAG